MAKREKYGVISMAAGKKHNSQFDHIHELKVMVESIRKVHPRLPVHVWVSPRTEIPGAVSETIPELVGSGWWTKYRRAPNSAWSGKFRIINGFKLLAFKEALQHYDRVLWLDGEVRVMQPLKKLLTLDCDIAMAKDYGNKGLCNWWNGGVILLQNTPQTHTLLDASWKQWQRESRKSEQIVLSDQIKKFRSAGKIKFKELNHRIWNVRPALASNMPIAERPRVVILHTRGHPFTGDERIWE